MYTRKLYLIRHGATPGNLQGRYVGCTDEGLSESSMAFLSKKRKLAGRVYTSPMKRCIQTAGCLCASQDYVVIESWRERDFGVFEYKNYRELKDDSRYQRWIDSNGTLPFPEGEDEESFYQRCISGFTEMLLKEEGCGADGTVICILHGGVIMALLFKLWDGGKSFYDYQCKNAEGYVLTCHWKDAGSPKFVEVERLELEEQSDGWLQTGF